MGVEDNRTGHDHTAGSWPDSTEMALRRICEKHGARWPIGMGLNPEPCSVQDQAQKADEAATKAAKEFKYDYGDGVTQISLEAWECCKGFIGRVTSIMACFEPLFVRTRRSSCGTDYDVHWNLRIEGEAGVLYLSGCNCGYGGEGPNGTRRILEELGVPPERARELMLQREFIIEFSEEGDGNDAGP